MIYDGAAISNGIKYIMKAATRQTDQTGLLPAKSRQCGPLLRDRSRDIQRLIERVCEKFVPVKIWKPLSEQECRRRKKREKQACEKMLTERGQ